MKWIKYKIVLAEDVLMDKEMGWNEVNEQIAKQEAYNGEYTVEDDGLSEPKVEPTTEELLNAVLGVTK